VKTVTEFCKRVESRLGWVPPAHGPKYSRYYTTSNRVARKMSENPSLYTFHNLELAIELLAQERKPRTPLGVFAHVERALALAAEDEMDVEVMIREACTYEEQRGDPQGWVTRFSRASGDYRAEALQEWRESVL
jgi:hypothetical protein